MFGSQFRWASVLFASSALAFQTACSASFFSNEPDADIVLGELGFDESGGPLLFNHPKGIATDGEVLMLADGNNHRVLVWSDLPTSNDEPDAVIGQVDFTGSHSGEADDRLKWPVDVAAGGGKYAIADTYNHRVLIYDQMPPAGPPSLILDGGEHGTEPNPDPGADRFAWPWGVWTDGETLIVSSTSASSNGGDIRFGGWVLIWTTFPTSADQPADIVLSANGKMGTPRSITTDGETFLMVGDHNAEGQPKPKGAWFWSEFPSANEVEPNGFWLEDNALGWPAGDLNDDGQLMLIGQGLSIFDSPPTTSTQSPDYRITGHQWHLRGGDGSTVAIADELVYVSDYNSNRVVGFNGFPQSQSTTPDFVIGAPDLQTNTLLENDYISNGTPVIAGDMLWIGDALNRRVHCWSTAPEVSAQPADAILSLDDEVIDVVVHNDTLIVAFANRGISIWDAATECSERSPDRRYEQRIGTVDAMRIQAIAQDDDHFYLIDGMGTLHVWPEIPSADVAPEFSINLGIMQGHLHTDGVHLVVSGMRDIQIIKVSDLSENAAFSTLQLPGKTMMTGQAIVLGDQLYAADLAGHRVLAWSKLADAFDGADPDVFIGASDVEDIDPDKTRKGLFWPMHLAYDGAHLYVAEYKFSGRVMRYSAE